jgi:hypothetical protein
MYWIDQRDPKAELFCLECMKIPGAKEGLQVKNCKWVKSF